MSTNYSRKNKTIDRFVSCVFNERAVSWGELEAFRKGEDCPLLESIVEAYCTAVKEVCPDIDLTSENLDSDYDGDSYN